MNKLYNTTLMKKEKCALYKFLKINNTIHDNEKKKKGAALTFASCRK